MNRGKRYYFVRHLPIHDPRRKKGHLAQIQLVDQHGQAISFGYIENALQKLELSGESVPMSVIESALRQPSGTSNFVDHNGTIIAPKDLLEP